MSGEEERSRDHHHVAEGGPPLVPRLAGDVGDLSHAPRRYQREAALHWGDRGVAQPGSALALGARSRRFESGRPDYSEPLSRRSCPDRRSLPERRSSLTGGRPRRSRRSSPERRSEPSRRSSGSFAEAEPEPNRDRRRRRIFMLVTFVLKSRRPAPRRSGRSRQQKRRRRPLFRSATWSLRRSAGRPAGRGPRARDPGRRSRRAARAREP